MKNRKYFYTDYYVYVHKKATSGEVFYVGKGTADRAWQKGYKRNQHWKRIVDKYGYTVELVETGYQNWYAIEREIQLIEFYGINNLCNITDGGENGGAGRKWSDESRAKLSASKKGKPNPLIAGEKNHMKTKESKEKISAILKGRKMPWMNGEKNPAFKLENRIATSLRCKGKKRPEITGANHKLAKKVLCIETEITFDSISEAKKWLIDNGKLLASHANISSACSGRLKKAYGFNWRYV